MNTHENENKIKFNDEQLFKIKNDDNIKSSICNAMYDNIDFNESCSIDQIRSYVNEMLNNVSNYVDENAQTRIQNMLNEFDTYIELIYDVENMFDEHNHDDNDN